VPALHGRDIATLRKLKKPCVVMVAQKFFQRDNVEGLTCLLASQDLTNGQRSQIVRVKGLTLKWAKKNRLISGVTTIFAKTAQIDDKVDTLIFPPGVTIKVRSIHSLFYFTLTLLLTTLTSNLS
jgi:hypothetical protein